MKKASWIPDKIFFEVMDELFGEMRKTFQRYYNFKHINGKTYVAKCVPVGICPGCGKQILEDEVKNIHHKTYRRQCYYAIDIIQGDGSIKHPCKKCEKDHPEEFEKCKECLVWMHQTCHGTAHGKENYRKEIAQDEE